jgi:tricarballylate dehydrogenase
VQKILYDGFKVEGVQVKSPGRIYDITAPCVILAAGGFQGDAEMRTRYLGPGWELAKVRGTRSTPATASRWRSTSAPALRQLLGCHAVQWDFNAPEYGDLAVATPSRSTPTPGRC